MGVLYQMQAKSRHKKVLSMIRPSQTSIRRTKGCKSGLAGMAIFQKIMCQFYSRLVKLTIIMDHNLEQNKNVQGNANKEICTETQLVQQQFAKARVI